MSDLSLFLSHMAAPVICSGSYGLNALHLRGTLAPTQRMLFEGTVSQTELSAGRRDRSDNSGDVHWGRYFVEALLCEDPSRRQTASQILENDLLRPAADSSSTVDPQPSVRFLAIRIVELKDCC